MDFSKLSTPIKEQLIGESSRVDQLEGSGSFSQPIGSVPIQVIGTGGKVRHAGTFSQSNPYAAQIAEATNNKDRDALYERSVNWEADRANLLEQRQYDDPVNQVARMRAAGINPDLVGSGGSGGVSSGSSAVQPQTIGQAKMSNAYDNTQMALDGVNTAMSVVQTICGFALSSQQFFEAVSTFPTRNSILQSQDKLAQTQATIAAGTQDSTIEAVNASNTSSASLGFMQQVVQATSLFSKDMTRDQRKKLLTSAGFSDSEGVDKLLDAVEVYETNPLVKEQYDSAQLAANERASEVSVFDTSYINQLNELKKRIDLDSYGAEAIRQSMLHAVASLVDTPDNVESIAAGEVSANAVNQERNQFILGEIKSQARSVYKRIMLKAAQVKDLESQRQDIISKSWSKKVFGKLSNAQQLAVKSLDAQIAMLESAANSELSGIYDIAMQAAKQQFVYNYGTYFGTGEIVKPFAFITPELRFSNAMFSSFNSPTPISETNFVNSFMKLFTSSMSLFTSSIK